MCTYKFMCVCMYIYMCVCMYQKLCIFLNTYISIDKCMCLCIYNTWEIETALAMQFFKHGFWNPQTQNPRVIEQILNSRIKHTIKS